MAMGGADANLGIDSEIVTHFRGGGEEVEVMGEGVSHLSRGTFYLLTSDRSPFSLEPTTSTNCNISLSQR